MKNKYIDADELLRDIRAVGIDEQGGMLSLSYIIECINKQPAAHINIEAQKEIDRLTKTIAELRKINAELAEAHAAEADALAAQSIDELKTRIWIQSGIIDGLEKALRVVLDVIKGGDGYATY